MKVEIDKQYENYIANLVQGAFDTQRDENSMNDFRVLNNLGCFGKEFCLYGIVYRDQEGTAYRITEKPLHLYNLLSNKYCK